MFLFLLLNETTPVG